MIRGALVVAAALLGGAMTASPPAAASVGACDDNVGITIVVDFQRLGGDVNLACAPDGAHDGLEALTKAGVSWEATNQGIVCRIAGRPGPETERCQHAPPANAYWSYWLAPRGGQWCYSNRGPFYRTPPPGTVEGWSFAGSEAAPPRYAPPPPIAGTTPNQIPPSDCTTPSETPSPSEPTTTRSTPPSNSTGQEERSSATAFGAATTRAPLPSAASSTTSITPTTLIAGTTSTTTSPAAPTTTNSTGVALNAVDLSDDGRGGSGSPVGVLVTAGVLGALGVGGVAVRRRRLARAAIDHST